MYLETARLRLREFVEDDWPAVLAYQADPLYLRFYHLTEQTAAGARDFVQMFLDQQAEQPRTKFQLALELKEDDRLVGNCGIRINDPEQREANIGYELASPLWGQGLMTEAATEIVHFGFEELNMRRIWSWCVAANIGSARVLAKVGMRQEGCLREKEFIKGEWRDHLLFAILDHEWRALQRPAVAQPAA
ncbi:MAG: GNAT family N-acetyltransferase [Caldilineaceae bacterium]|nr:GNAT family N-acetyltransferase [Caldilineaceae bacterium]